MDVLKPLRVFIDCHGEAGHFITARTLMQQSSRMLSFVFLELDRGRYLVPSLCGYGDLAVWVSPRAPIRTDISQIWKQARAQDLCAVYVPVNELNDPEPSLMLFRNKFCERLTPGYVYQATPDQLAPWVWAGGRGNVGTVEV